MDTMSKKASKRCTTSCSVKKIRDVSAGRAAAGGAEAPKNRRACHIGSLACRKTRRDCHTGSQACRKNRRAHQIGSRACRKDPAGTPGTSCGHAKIAALSMPRPGLLSTAGSGLHDPLFSQMALRHSFKWPWGIFRMAPKVFGWP